MADLPLEEDALLEAAVDASGLSDFGDGSFREGLGVLVETYANGAGLDARGRKLAARRILQLLSTRLRVAENFRKHPQIRERPVPAPVFLTGLPRTGTSALFNLLGADPAARPLLLWEAFFPDLLEGHPADRPDPRHSAVRAGYARMAEKDPDFARIHQVSADTPEECVLLLAHAFRDVQMGIEVLVEPWASWFQAQDLRPAYVYYRELLQLLDFQRPGERWLLKTPAHLWALDVLVDLFPDAGIVMTHRDPREAVASYCSMLDTLLTSRGFAPLPDLGERTLEYLARSLERGLGQRARIGDDRFVDVDYAEFVRDPESAARGIYDRFGLPLATQTERALAAHVQANPQHRHGSHDYDLERYGLTPARVLDRLAAYVERFQPGA